MRPVTPSVLLLSLLCASACLAQSGNPAPMQPLKTHDPRLEKVTEAMHASKSPTYVALSPDGATVAWTLRRSEGTQIGSVAKNRHGRGRPGVAVPSERQAG